MSNFSVSDITENIKSITRNIKIAISTVYEQENKHFTENKN